MSLLEVGLLAAMQDAGGKRRTGCREDGARSRAPGAVVLMKSADAMENGRDGRWRLQRNAGWVMKDDAQRSDSAAGLVPLKPGLRLSLMQQRLGSCGLHWRPLTWTNADLEEDGRRRRAFATRYCGTLLLNTGARFGLYATLFSIGGDDAAAELPDARRDY
jgi:hypothetical protein